jgi:hypothetical protein
MKLRPGHVCPSSHCTQSSPSYYYLFWVLFITQMTITMTSHNRSFASYLTLNLDFPACRLTDVSLRVRWNNFLISTFLLLFLWRTWNPFTRTEFARPCLDLYRLKQRLGATHCCNIMMNDWKGQFVAVGVMLYVLCRSSNVTRSDGSASVEIEDELSDAGWSLRDFVKTI